MVKHIEIKSHNNKILRGYLTIPEDFSGLMVLMFHGFTGNKTEHGGLFRDFSRILEQEKIASIRMDFSGNGESDGSFKDFTFDTLMDEANLLVQVANRINQVKKLCLLGFSMGGAVAPMTLLNNPNEVDALLLWSPAGNILDIIRNIYEKTNKLENQNADYPNFEISKAMYDSLKKYQIYDQLERIEKPTQIIHGKKDQAVSYEYGLKYANLIPKAQIHIIENANHGYDRREEKFELFEQSLNFLKRLNG